MRYIIIFFMSTCVFCCSYLFADENLENGTFDENFKVSASEFKIRMNIDGGNVRVTRNSQSDVCHVLIEYNPDRCDVDVRFYEKRNELDINLDFHEFGFWNKEDHGDSWTAHVTIELPYDPPISLDAEVKAGECDFDIGDIHLRNFELNNWAGEVKVDFDKPNRTEMDVFDINVHVGETELLNLGNANMKEAAIDGGIGEMRVDFSGEMKTRVMARVDLDIGETNIILPEQLAVKMKVSKFLFLSEIQYPDWFERKGRYYYSENYKEDEKSLYLDISTGIGELRVQIE